MWTLLALLCALLAFGGGATFAPNKELLECASQILYMNQHAYKIPENYNRNIPPGKNTTVYIGINVNRVSGVDENKEEITLDVFLQVSWEDGQLQIPPGMPFIDLPWEFRQLIWTPDLYIWQLQTMRTMSVLQEMASLRIYSNSTVSVNIGATITIKCQMDFVLYPLDVQKCAIDFGSYKYTSEDVRFEWHAGAPWRGLVGKQRNQFRLPKYVVTFVTDKSNHIRNFGEGEHSAARLQIKLSRELRSYLLESYLPSSLFVIISWGSFCVIPEIVPGRMVLLVTTLLSLVTMFDTDSPILDTMPPSGSSRGFMVRVATMVDHGVMFCGAQHGALDKFALMLFPICFFLFTVIYWTTYLSEAHRATLE
ncbi:PREDICTED: gamma-aminobutyric acid receptor subunit delta-like [Papilio polytes]|uniref:gamma-aminobutyric acid receptor subunit delta-like n=1 Tax=Papilio polytes TaxID=76194 RepID=UPI000675FC20|nr:PREDICTED: gamma-aminobutyric acid receptor subunit delta-like [Papilio polytes]